MRTNTLPTRCEQRVVRYLAMRTNIGLTSQSLGKQGAALSRFSLLIPSQLPTLPFFSKRKSTPIGRWAIAYGAVGDRPWGGGRSPTGRWALAHRPVGVDFLRGKNENIGLRNGVPASRVVGIGGAASPCAQTIGWGKLPQLLVPGLIFRLRLRPICNHRKSTAPCWQDAVLLHYAVV